MQSTSDAADMTTTEELQVCNGIDLGDLVTVFDRLSVLYYLSEGKKLDSDESIVSQYIYEAYEAAESVLRKAVER